MRFFFPSQGGEFRLEVSDRAVDRLVDLSRGYFFCGLQRSQIVGALIAVDGDVVEVAEKAELTLGKHVPEERALKNYQHAHRFAIAAHRGQLDGKVPATGYARWFERLLSELNFELWIGNAAEIRAARVRKQKTDRQDALLLRKLLVEDRFPRIWVPGPENRLARTG